MGKTPPSCRRRTRSGKHPHLRRDNRNARLVRLAPPETSPPAWGKPPRPTLHLLRLGNIPTYVGKTRIQALSSRPFGKHPHLRGENQAKSIRAAKLMETSPPAWGKRPEKGAQPGDQGNIPTCVGKTDFDVRLAHYLRKHPHLRGENSERRNRSDDVTETSPPAWGKLPLRPHCCPN